MQLHLDPHRKLIVAYTSSLDEYYAGWSIMEALGYGKPPEGQVFSDQIEWIKALMEHVRHRKDLQLVVRIHPREGNPFKGTRKSSEHLAYPAPESFADTPSNVRIVWPAEAISSYDLAEICDLALVSWSTIGLEVARMGVPVLASTKGIAAFPDDDFIRSTNTAAEYFQVLESLLTSSASLETLARAFRWYNLQHLGATIDFGDVIPSPDFYRLPAFHRPKEAVLAERIVIGGETALDINLERQRQYNAASAKTVESEALKAHCRRFVHLLMTGADADPLPAAAAAHSDEALAASVDTAGITIHSDSSNVAYAWNGRIYRKYSPVCARLIPIITTQSAATDMKQ